MKTRNGLISNSSTTSFVVYVPNNLTVKDIPKECWDDFDSNATERDVETLLKQLKTGQSIWEDEDCCAYNVLREYFESHNLVLFTVDCNSGDAINPVSKKQMLQIIKENK